jgi:hypothetical protein
LQHHGDDDGDDASAEHAAGDGTVVVHKHSIFAYVSASTRLSSCEFANAYSACVAAAWSSDQLINNRLALTFCIADVGAVRAGAIM